jgi:hypothetical protein
VIKKFYYKYIWPIVNSCYMPDSALHKFFEAITGDLICKCCIFYRGVFIGLALQVIVVLVAFLIRTLIK